MSDLIESKQSLQEREIIFSSPQNLSNIIVLVGAGREEGQGNSKERNMWGKTMYKMCRQSNRSKKARNYKDTNLRIDPSTNAKKKTV